MDDFLQELDEDVEGMQSTILFLQQELKLAKDTIASLERENSALKNGGNGDLTITAEPLLTAIAHREQSITDSCMDSSTTASNNIFVNGKKMSQVPSAYVARSSGGVTVLPTSALIGENSNTDGNTDDDNVYETATIAATTTLATAHYNHNSSLNNNNCSDRFLIKDCPTKLLFNNNSSSLGNSSSAVTTATAQEPRTLRSSSRLAPNSVNATGEDLQQPQRTAKLSSSSNGSALCLNVYDDQQQPPQIQPQPQRRPNGGPNIDEPINYTHNYPPRKGN